MTSNEFILRRLCHVTRRNPAWDQSVFTELVYHDWTNNRAKGKEKSQNNMNFCAFIFVLFLFNHKTIGMQEIVVSEHIWCPTENFNYRLIDGECFYYETVKKHSLQIAQENCAGKFPNGGKLFEPRSLIMNAIVLKVN